MTDVTEVVAGRPLDELDALIAAATAQKEVAKETALAEFAALVETVKTKGEALGVNVKSYFVEKKEYAPKYANPANPTETFNGRGPRPAWLKTLLEGVPKEGQKEAMNQYLIAA